MGKKAFVNTQGTRKDYGRWITLNHNSHEDTPLTTVKDLVQTNNGGGTELSSTSGGLRNHFGRMSRLFSLVVGVEQGLKTKSLDTNEGKKRRVALQKF